MPRTKPLLKKAAKKAAKRIPRQKTLPGMADARIAVLERAALRYADVRDERMEWTKKEVEAKKRVQDLMHEQKRQHYERQNIEISLEPEGEKVIVRVRGRKEAPDQEPAETPDTVEEPESPENQPVDEPPETPDSQYADPEVEEEEEESESSAF